MEAVRVRDCGNTIISPLCFPFHFHVYWAGRNVRQRDSRSVEEAEEAVTNLVKTHEKDILVLARIYLLLNWRILKMNVGANGKLNSFPRIQQEQ